MVRERTSPKVAAFLQSIDHNSVYISVMTTGEIWKGIASLAPSRRRQELEFWFERDVRARFAGRILPVTERIAEKWSVLTVEAKQRGTPLSVVDGSIAATALEHNLTLVTRNTKDFSGLGIRLINPWET
jgi:predicted nucleic acid-binding protein